MRKITVFLVAIAVSLVSYVKGQDVSGEFNLADGLEVRVWAKTPQFFNPTNIDIDAQGRVWVAEGVNYRQTFKPKNDFLTHPKGDRIMILADTDGDGECDSSKMFVEDKDLICPLGVAVIGDKVIVSCSPNIIVYTDADHDDKPDKKEIFLTGFGGHDHDHGAHAFVGGPDGKWYFNVGNDGPHQVKDHSGWWLHSGSCYVYGPTGNTGNRKSSDGRVWTGGIAFRIDPDGKHLTPIGHNFRNSYEIALDSFGNVYQTDNDDDGNAGCRFSWLMEGASMGYFNADGTRAWAVDRRPGQATVTAHWHQDDPGVVPIQDPTGAGAPTGLVVYEGGMLSRDLVGCVLDCDAGRSVVRIHKPIRDGAGFQWEHSNLIESKAPATTNPSPDDRSHWFRPSDVAIGTDGAIYIADWYDPVVGGHDLKDKTGQGRILRIAPRGASTSPKQVEMNTLEQQLAATDSPAVNVRYAAMMKLSEQTDGAFARVQRMLDPQNSPQRRARAIWLLAQFGSRGISSVESMLRDANEDIRMAALRALRQYSSNVLPQLTELASDSSPAVRREVAIALRDVPLQQAQPMLLKLAEGFDGRDRFYLEALGIGCDGKEEQIFPLLAERLEGRDPLHWLEAMAAVAWRLHPVVAIDAFKSRAAAFSLSPAQRAQSIVALAFIKDPRAADVMAALATQGPDDTRTAAKWWLHQRADNDWKDFAAAKPYATKEPSTKAAKKLAEERKTIFDQSATQRDRLKAATNLAIDPEGGAFILALAAEGKFPQDLADAVAEPISHNPDLGVRALSGQYFPRRNAAGVAMPPLTELASMKGDAARGRTIFYGATAGCARCHSFNHEGRDVGPDLTSIRTKYARKELLDAILNPSAAILMGYEPWIIKTKSNEVYSGFILADGPTMTIKESSGEKINLQAADITLRKRQLLSIMPDNIAVGLSAQDLADLAEFLLTAPTN